MSTPTVPGPDLPYGTVRHHALATVADSDDAGLHPDHHLLDGLGVEFRPSVQVIVWTGNGQPITHVPQVIKGRYDSEGRLRYVQRDGTMSEAQDVRLVVTEHPDMQPSGWAWRVSWKGAGATLPSGSFTLPADAVVDLSSVLLAGSTPQAPVVFADLLAAASDLQATIDGAGTDALPAPTTDGKLLGVVGTAYALVDPPAGGGGGMPDTTGANPGDVLTVDPTGTTAEWAPPTGTPGASAYDVAVANGFAGTETEWLASLEGQDGTAATVTVGTVTTGAPGSAASVSNSGTPSAAVLDFTLPAPYTFHIGTTPPTDTSAIWLDTSGA